MILVALGPANVLPNRSRIGLARLVHDPIDVRSPICGAGHKSLYGDFSVKSLVWLSAIFSLSFSTAGACAKSGAVDRESEAGVNPDREQGEQFEGSLPWGAKHRAATLYSVGSAGDPDHEAVNGFGSKAPRRRAHSADGIGAMELFGSPPPRIATLRLVATVDPPRDDHVALFRLSAASRRPPGFRRW